MLRYFWKVKAITPSNSFCTGIFSKLKDLGVSATFLDQAKSSQHTAKHLEDIEKHLKGNNVSSKKTGNLLIGLATKLTPTLEKEKLKLAEYVVGESINTNSELEKALAYVKHQAIKQSAVDWVDFENHMGIGKKVHDEKIIQEIEDCLHSLTPSLKQDILISDKKYQSGVLRQVRDKLPQYDGKKLFLLFETAAKNYLQKQKDLEKKPAELNVNDGNSSLKDGKHTNIVMKEEEQTHIWDKIASLKGRDLCFENNSQQAYQRHLEARNGINYILRFPPEPNGYLHLGHAKALRTNFYSAQKLNGICYLRYDDTNPEKEKLDYIESIKDNVLWFGFQPYKTTYSSDYFPQIFDCAMQLVEKGLAYACNLTHEEMAELRQKKEASPFRTRSIQENIQIFKDMKDGKYKEGEVCMRLKIDAAHPNPTMRDPVMYRVKDHPHPKTGTAWKIYPTYDFTHCLCDSIENITHSLCTLEFEIRRDLYYWILDSLDMYKPVVWEYSRLNISNSVLSKRKLLRLIQSKAVSGWEDPRLLTINALRKRGVRPEAINSFVDLVNVSRRGNENVIDSRLLDYCVRQDLEGIVTRTMAVLDPIQLTITNFNEFKQNNKMEEVLTIPLIPKDETQGHRKITPNATVLVDASDVREHHQQVIDKDVNSKQIDRQGNQQKKSNKNMFIGIYPGARVALKYLGVIEVDRVDLANRQVFCRLISVEESARKEADGQIHWLNPNEAQSCEVRLYNDLFSADPDTFDDILQALNPNSLVVHKKAMISNELLEILKNRNLNTVQFERLGYFTVDSDALKQGEVLIHRTVSLKDRVNRNTLV